MKRLRQHEQCASEQATKRSGTATRSTSVTTDQPSATDYGLTLPSEAEVIADLMRLVGADVASVFGRSLAVRVNTYIALSSARTSA